jgi:non-heme chloroperoxidase
MAYTVKSMELSTGVRLPYVEQGPSSGRPVIFLHGVTDSWRSFESAMPHLSQEIRAFAVTQRGHAGAGQPASGYRTRQFAADIAAFVQELNLGPVVLVGHSMGSTHAMRFAIDFPELTLGLVCGGSIPSYRNCAGIVDLWRSAVSTLSDPIDPSFVREFQESTVSQPIAQEFMDTAIQESLRMPAAVWRAVFESFFEDDFATELDRISAPVLLVWGDQDGLTSRNDQETLLSTISGSQLVVYEGAGHALHWEQPERFASDVTGFVQSLVHDAERRGRAAHA